MGTDAVIIRRLRAAHRLSDRLLHDVRLTCKRQRAWWQLARPVASKSAVAGADRRLREVARATAPLRESHVMRQVLTRLADRSAPPRIRSALGAAARQIVTPPPAVENTGAFAELRDTLVRVFQSDAAAWRRLHPAAEVDSLIVAAAVRSYRRARRRGRRAVRRGRAKDLHAWRKWVKVNQAQLEFLRAERPNVIAGDTALLARLARQLGRGQDLTVLKTWFVWRESTGAIGADQARRLRAFIDTRQKEVRARCERLGRRLFSVKPKSYAAALQPAAGRNGHRRVARNRRAVATPTRGSAGPRG